MGPDRRSRRSHVQRVTKKNPPTFPSGVLFWILAVNYSPPSLREPAWMLSAVSQSAHSYPAVPLATSGTPEARLEFPAP